MASLGGLGRFSRGKPQGPSITSTHDESKLENPDSNWMTFGSNDEPTDDFGFNDFDFQDVVDQNFDIEGKSQMPPAKLSTGLSMFKAMPVEGHESDGKQPGNGRDESSPVFPTGKMDSPSMPRL